VKRLFIPLLVLGGMITAGSSAMAGPFIEVKNNSVFPRVLSDLVVLDKNNNNRVILQPSNAADDVTMASGETRIFNAGFEINRYTISLTENMQERRTAVFSVTQLVPEKVGFLENPNPSGPDIFLAIDSSQSNFDPPAEGTILSFTNGSNSTLPGWFVGTAIDFDHGIVSNPYTGSAEIGFTGFEVTTVPEPESVAMLLAGLGLIGTVIRGRKKQITF
jgi:hypothetical protein